MEEASSDCDEEIVWAKGDKCLSPFSGDEKLYKAVIDKISRTPVGQVVARVKFDGYGDGDSEEIDVKRLRKVKVKVKESSSKAGNSAEPSGMFKPLQGSELSDRLKAKYGSVEDGHINVKTEKLSEIVFKRKSPVANRHSTTLAGSRSNTPGSQSRKGVVAIGGESVKACKKNGSTRRTPSPRSRNTAESLDDPETTPSTKKKYRLDVTGGAAIDSSKDLRTTKRLSDISSILDPKSVKHALDKQNSPLANPADDGNYLDRGFDEEDMEKPKFNFKPDGAKVPYILSDSGETPVIQVPATINQYLRDYQREGIKFLYSHYKYNRGAILGDDMGLGKTVQVIGFLSALLGKHGNRVDVMRQKPRFIRKLSDSASVKADCVTMDPFLIIGPGCVLYNWLEEFETWGYFTVRKFHGVDKEECLADVKKGKVEIVVTTFETFRDHQEILNSVTWSAVIADEVQKIKGLKAQTTKALRSINTRRRYGLTGTALQNNLLEFWSLLDWAQPGCLGRQVDFEDEYVHAIEGGQRLDANKRELALARKKKEKFAEIRRGMMIRRLKTLIADQLPRKDDNVVFCKLSQLQTSIYKTILNNPSMHLVLHMDDPCPCDSGIRQSKCCFKKTAEGESVKSLMFTFMHLLLKTSNHVAMLIPTNKTSEKQAKQARKICEVALKEHPEFVSQTKEASFKTLSDPKYCGKMKILQGLLRVFYKEHGNVLLFSYSTQVLDIIEQYLMSTGYEYRRIDGAVSSKKRMVIVREFNADPNIFICLISTKAGGLGLNLTGANKVVIFDPNWNPTHDLQAQDRAFRIGQRRNVQVFRLITAGTIEENMYLRQIYKQQLLNVTVEDENARRYFYAVQGNKKLKGELFGVNNMFKLQTGDSCLTMDILKRNERVESALGGYDIAKYLPPVIRVEDGDDYSDVIDDQAGREAAESEEDIFNQFFSSQDPIDDGLEDNNLRDEDIASGYATDNSSDLEIKTNSPKESSSKGSNLRSRKTILEKSDSSDDDPDISVQVKTDKSKATVAFERGEIESKNNKKVSFRTPPTSGKVKGYKKARCGKVLPFQSLTGKGPLKKSMQDEDDSTAVKYDQTLAGTFNDVSDVFDNCGVVHIHENVKVVGGSKAEDHMTKCAITDVYELHQNSQDLAVQCDPLSESSEDEVPKPTQRGSARKQPIRDHNTVRSTVVGNTKVLIGQTPKTFRMKQIEGMQQFHKSGSLLEFAELVLSSSVEERVALLNSYYESGDPSMRDIIQMNEKLTAPKDRSDSKKIRNVLTNRKRNQEHRKPAQSIGFLEEGLSDDSKSPSFTGSSRGAPRLDEHLSEEEESSIDVGLKLSPGWQKRRTSMKRTPQRHKTQVTPARLHRQVPPSYLENEVDTSEMTDASRCRNKSNDLETWRNRREKVTRIHSISQNQEDFVQSCDIDSSVLLDEMGKESEEKSLDIESDTVGDSENGTAIITRANTLNNLQKRQKLEENIKHKVGEKKQTSKTVIVVQTEKAKMGANVSKHLRKSDVSESRNTIKSPARPNEISILDDLFAHSDHSPKRRKPPPAKGRSNVLGINVNESKHNSTECKTAQDNFDPFKVIDEIFSDGTGDEHDNEVLLEASTLKNESMDCFDDPKMWKKKKRKATDKRNIVDRLIADSDAEFNNLFTSGKMRRKEESNKEESSVEGIDGSLSLFSS